MRTPKKLTLLPIIALSTFIITSTNAGPTPEIYSTGMFSKTAIGGYDPVAYFTQKKAMEGNKKFHYRWHCANWRFISQKNLNTFRKSPGKYAPQYGGWCAYAMSQDAFIKSAPKQWTVYKNKLYLNVSAKVKNMWRKQKNKYIAAADTNWQKFQSNGSMRSCKK